MGGGVSDGMYDVRNEAGDHIHGAYSAPWLPHVGDTFVIPRWNKEEEKYYDTKYLVLRVEHVAYGGARVIVRPA